MADLRCEWTFKAERPEQGLREAESGNAELSLTDTIHVLYGELVKYGYMITELYDLTIAELTEMLTARRQGQAYDMWRQASLIGLAVFGKHYPKTPEEALPELFPPKKKYKMPDFLKERMARKGK